jgi:hypothetical protein
MWPFKKANPNEEQEKLKKEIESLRRKLSIICCDLSIAYAHDNLKRIQYEKWCKEQGINLYPAEQTEKMLKIEIMDLYQENRQLKELLEHTNKDKYEEIERFKRDVSEFEKENERLKKRIKELEGEKHNV